MGISAGDGCRHKGRQRRHSPRSATLTVTFEPRHADKFGLAACRSPKKDPSTESIEQGLSQQEARAVLSVCRLPARWRFSRYLTLLPTATLIVRAAGGEPRRRVSQSVAGAHGRVAVAAHRCRCARRARGHRRGRDVAAVTGTPAPGGPTGRGGCADAVVGVYGLADRALTRLRRGNRTEPGTVHLA